MLDQHLVDFVVGELRVKGRTAERNKIAECSLESAVLPMSLGDVFVQGLGEIRNSALELIHRTMKLALIGFVVRQKAIEQIRDLCRFAECKFSDFAPVLVEDCDLSVFENSVTRRVSCLEFLLYFG